ncbi:RVT_3 domain-containing protein [Gossypium australe]|uniref:RVT_3 domain-containing protein n=1 Tax=Gossypium australe TaxID=47621 RepID=A0A5B6VBK0_9ROSI|nr:RVT_3 domain-containing protein [Gossypium australe]
MDNIRWWFYGVGVLLVDPDKNKWQYELFLGFQASNNTAKYEALISGLQLARQLKASKRVVPTNF